MEVHKDGMAWVGMIDSISGIEGADRIVRATIGCGRGGRWGAVVPLGAAEGDLVVCFLPDAIVPKDRPSLAFMEKRNWRVSMMRLKGAPSEVLAIPLRELDELDFRSFGEDVTDHLGVMKYEKETHDDDALGRFPAFIPKTEEPLFQQVPKLVEACLGREVYVTTKYDGTSQTVYAHSGHFGACSRSLELKEKPGIAVWELVKRYGLKAKLPHDFAIQWECVGPGIQKNPLGLKEIDCRVFNLYDIARGRFWDYADMKEFVETMGLPVVEAETVACLADEDYHDEALRLRAEGAYPNGKHREGIVVRPTTEARVGNERVSFKVINLKYKG